CSRLSLSASRPEPAGDAGRLRAPVGTWPIRSTVHAPAGAFQLNVPSGRMLAVRSTTSDVATDFAAATMGVGTVSYSKMNPLTVFSSQRFTRAAVVMTASVTWYSLGT